jgi:hypothetical protein
MLIVLGSSTTTNYILDTTSTPCELSMRHLLSPRFAHWREAFDSGASWHREQM